MSGEYWLSLCAINSPMSGVNATGNEKAKKKK